jgi:hypothetical protein
MTAAQYHEHLKVIEAANPREPLLHFLRSGYTALNAIYLHRALKNMSEMPILVENYEGEAEGNEELPDHDTDDAHDGPTYQALTAEIRRAYNHIRASRNEYHRCRTDDERAKVADQVRSAWMSIMFAIKKRKAYADTGQIIEVEVDDDELPDNAVMLAKRLNSIRAQIAQEKRKILEIAALKDSDPTRAKRLDTAERQLKRLEVLKGMAVEKLNSMKNE